MLFACAVVRIGVSNVLNAGGKINTPTVGIGLVTIRTKDDGAAVVVKFNNKPRRLSAIMVALGVFAERASRLSNIHRSIQVKATSSQAFPAVIFEVEYR